MSSSGRWRGGGCEHATGLQDERRRRWRTPQPAVDSQVSTRVPPPLPAPLAIRQSDPRLAPSQTLTPNHMRLHSAPYWPPSTWSRPGASNLVFAVITTTE